jgi:hypothetical protein
MYPKRLISPPGKLDFVSKDLQVEAKSWDYASAGPLYPSNSHREKYYCVKTGSPWVKSQ